MALPPITEIVVNCQTGLVTTQVNPDTRSQTPPPVLDVTTIVNNKLTEPGAYRLAQILGMVP